MHYKKQVTHVESHVCMCSESAQEQRIALYKRDQKH